MRNVMDKSCREYQNMHFIFNNFFQKSSHLWDNVGKYDSARQATDGSIMLCRKYARIQTHANNI